MIMGSDDIEKVAQLQFSESRKKDRAERLGNDIRPTGAKLYQQARYHVGAHSDFHMIHSLAEGTAPTNANNLSVIGIYPAKKSNRNQKNNAQKESIGLCKKRIDKMEMPTKSK